MVIRSELHMGNMIIASSIYSIAKEHEEYVEHILHAADVQMHDEKKRAQ